MNKKIATISIVSVAFLLGVMNVSAEVSTTSVGVQNSIQVTSVPVIHVSSVIGDEDTSTTTTCLLLSSENLRYKSKDATTNGEVSDLQDFLIASSFLKSQATGNFGLATFAAVKSFQIKMGLKGTGYVGLMTKGKIKEISCNGGQMNSSDHSINNRMGQKQPGGQDDKHEGKQRGREGEMNDRQDMSMKRSSSTQPTACTMEARMCPNGSMMPRNPNNCEWLAFKCGEQDRATTMPMQDMMRPHPEMKASSSDMRGTQVGMPPLKRMLEKPESRIGTTTPPNPPMMKVCTDEVYKCPNGKMVPRNPKTCEWMTSLCNATSTMPDMMRTDKGQQLQTLPPVSAQ